MLIEGFEDYEIYENGNIRSLKSNKILKPRLDSKGNYLILGLYKDGKQYTKYVHRLVAENFIPNPQNKMKLFTSAKDAERKTGISRASIVQCIRGRYHTAGGYRWKYQNDGGK